MKHTLLLTAFLATSVLAQDETSSNDWSRIYIGSVPSVTGDGKRFAFEWNDHIWLASTSGGYAQFVGNGTALDSWPVMNRDGTKIAFSSSRDGGSKVFEYDIRSETIRQITFHSEATWPRAWHPDGRRLICLGYRATSSSKKSLRTIIVDTDRRSAEEIPVDFPAGDPCISPDGESMLFTFRGDDQYRKRPHSTSPEAGQIWMMNLATREFTPMVVHESDCRDAIWLPDGKSFYYLDARGGVRNVWHHDIATGKDTQLTFFTDDHVFQPSLSADGKTMLFRQKFDFWKFDPTNPEVAPEKIILHPEFGYMEHPATRRRYYTECWNNDFNGDVAFCDNGTQIAFTAGGDLYVMDTVICEPTLVHGETITHERECVFAIDGSALYFFSDRGDASALIRAVPDEPNKPWWENQSFTETTLFGWDEQRLNLTISPDGSRLAWEDPLGVITFADTNGNIISKGPPSVQTGDYAWSPDGKWVAAQLCDECANYDIWIVSTDGETAPYNLSRNFKFDGEPAWSPDGQIIAFISERPEFNNEKYLCYVYLDKKVEDAENYMVELDNSRKTIRDNAIDTNRYAKLEMPGEKNKGKKVFSIDFNDLSDRVRVVQHNASTPFFRWDSRTVAYAASRHRTDTVKIPKRLNAEKLFDCTGTPRAWLKKDDKVLWIVDRKPAHGTKKFKFGVYQNTNFADYQELAFWTAWGRIKNIYYDPNTHGVDWSSMPAKYLDAFRNVMSYSAYQRLMNMLLGELDSSHLGFYASDNSRIEWVKNTATRDWRIITAHLGLNFEPNKGREGWTISSVIPNGPADRNNYNFKPGDVILAIDGIDVHEGMDPTIVLNGPENRKVRVAFRRKGSDAKETAIIDSCNFTAARDLILADELRANRRFVHENSDGRLGYINIEAMNWKSYMNFQKEVFSEGYGKDGLIIDVRWNYGGFTADQILQILFGADHSRSVTRTCGEGYLFGYWRRPVWSKPIVVLCNEKTVSNGEIFSHSIQTLKRGKLVGRETNGGVIGTHDRYLLDMGTFRDARYGWFLLDGKDMENNGAKPDVPVDNLPPDLDKGIDRQLEKAIEVLKDEVKEWGKQNPPIELKYAR